MISFDFSLGVFIASLISAGVAVALWFLKYKKEKDHNKKEVWKWWLTFAFIFAATTFLIGIVMMVFAKRKGIPHKKLTPQQTEMTQMALPSVTGTTLGLEPLPLLPSDLTQTSSLPPILPPPPSMISGLAPAPSRALSAPLAGQTPTVIHNNFYGQTPPF